MAVGQAVHPNPLPRPSGMRPCANAPELYYRWESALGGAALLGTEGLAVILINAGYGLEDAVLDVRGVDREGREIFSVRREVKEIPRGEEVRVEVPSYDVPGDPSDVAVSLVAAELSHSQ